MKVFVFLTLALAAVSAAPAPYKLTDDFREFFQLIHFTQILVESAEELQVNGELIQTVEYLNANNWANIVEQGKKDKNFDQLRKVLLSKSIDFEGLGDQITKYLKAAKIGKADGKSTFKTYLTKVQKHVQISAIVGWVARKELLSADFRELMKVLRTKETHAGIDAMVLSKEFQGLEKLLLTFDVDVRPLLQIAYNIFGWGKVPVPPPF